MNRQLLEKNPKEILSALLQKSQQIRFENIPIKGYERVIKITDKKSGLTALIALHDLTQGPALGGTRIFPYASFNDALEDVLRLSKGMTYKSAISEVGFGGGKSVIIADPKTEKKEELLLAFGTAVEQLGGIYICAEDVGCTTQDVTTIRKATRYVVGLPHAKSSGDPGPFTAWGVYRGIQATCKKLFGSESVEGRKIALQGLGNVGMNLLHYLFWAGAEVIVADRDPAKVALVQAKYKVASVSIEEIFRIECDIFAPCALGGILNDSTIPFFRCKGIAGGANNQLLKDSHADALKKRGILYCPDFVINSGGLINVAAELEEDGYHPSFPRYKIHHLYDTILAIYEIAEKNNESTQAAALALVEYRLKYGIGKRTTAPIFHHE